MSYIIEEIFLIITDSLSCLMALKSPNEKNPIILKLKQKIHIALSKNINISLLWIPSHVGIEGNEMADELAKEALSNNINKIKIPYTDFKHNITKIIQSKWQKNWNKETSNKLHYIQPKLTVKTKSELNRNSNVKFTRIKIGHTNLTHSFLLKGETAPICNKCNKTLTIKHIFTECKKFEEKRDKILKTKDLRVIFQLINPPKIIEFLKETNLFKVL